jgi:tRNA(Ile)-lysidine synthase
MDLKDTVLKTILLRDPPLLTRGERVLVAVSGGPDSLALLHVLSSLREDLGLNWLGAAHADHGLRGSDSDGDREFVENFCSSNDIPLTVSRLDVRAIRETLGIGMEEAARLARYQFLEKAAIEAPASKIATAHTQDDRVETVLHHIIRGTGLEGLKGIPYQREHFIRPLLDATRKDVEAYCAMHGLAPRIDASNDDTAISTRNRIRHELLPVLERDFNSNVRRAIVTLSEIAVRDSEYLIGAAEKLLPTLSVTLNGGALKLDGHSLLNLPDAMRRHVLRRAIYHVRGTLEYVGADGVEAVLSALREQRSFCHTTPSPHTRILVKPREVRIVPGLK